MGVSDEPESISICQSPPYFLAFYRGEEVRGMFFNKFMKKLYSIQKQSLSLLRHCLLSG